MKRIALNLILSSLLVFSLNPANAQDPVILTEYEETPVSVGQPFLLRVTVLVPTHMPKPPIFPSFEATNVLVRLPEKSSTSTSQEVDGVSLFGITRLYRLYPMEAGTTRLPPEDVTLFYADPDTNEVVTFTDKTPEISLVASLPDGAKDFNPPLLAQAFSGTQTITPQEGPIKVGDSIERVLNFKITGTSPLFIPPQLASDDITGLGAYPQDPKVVETSESGILSGTREERIVYIAQSAGMAVLPDIALKWYNLKTDKVETINLPGLTTEISQPSAVAKSLNQNLALTFVAAALAILTLWQVWKRFLKARIRELRETLERNYSNTLYAAHREAQKAAKQKDLSALFRAVEISGATTEPLEQAILDLTHSTYGASRASKKDVNDQWIAISKVLTQNRPPLPVAEILGIQPSQKLEFGHAFGNQGAASNKIK